MRAKRVHYLFIHYREQVLQNGLDFRENLHIVVSHHAQAGKIGCGARLPRICCQSFSSASVMPLRRRRARCR
jgi:hypothetical protein